MENMRVRELMVPVNSYCTIAADATLHEAVLELEKARMESDAGGGRPYRAILVLDANGNVIGKLSQFDVLRSLEPKYSEVDDVRKLSGFGITAEYLRSMLETFDLWQTPMADLCRKAADVKVSDLLRSPLEGEIIDAEATLNQAVHQFVVGHHQSLLVTSEGRIVGILRLVDLFHEITEQIKACKI